MAEAPDSHREVISEEEILGYRDRIISVIERYWSDLERVEVEKYASKIMNTIVKPIVVGGSVCYIGSSFLDGPVIDYSKNFLEGFGKDIFLTMTLGVITINTLLDTGKGVFSKKIILLLKKIDDLSKVDPKKSKAELISILEQVRELCEKEEFEHICNAIKNAIKSKNPSAAHEMIKLMNLPNK